MLVLSRLMIKRGHTEFLMDQVLGFSAGGSVSIICVVTEVVVLFLRNSHVVAVKAIVLYLNCETVNLTYLR